MSYDTHCSSCGMPYSDFAREGAKSCECHKMAAQAVRDFVFDKPALSASPVAQEPVAWQLRQCPRVFWTSWRRCSREDYEQVQKTGVFGDAPAQSRQLFPSSPPATPAGLGADEIARIIDDAINKYGSLMFIQEHGWSGFCAKVREHVLALLSRAGDQK